MPKSIRTQIISPYDVQYIRYIYIHVCTACIEGIEGIDFSVYRTQAWIDTHPARRSLQVMVSSPFQKQWRALVKRLKKRQISDTEVCHMVKEQRPSNYIKM